MEHSSVHSSIHPKKSSKGHTQSVNKRWQNLTLSLPWNNNNDNNKKSICVMHCFSIASPNNLCYYIKSNINPVAELRWIDCWYKSNGSNKNFYLIRDYFFLFFAVVISSSNGLRKFHGNIIWMCWNLFICTCIQTYYKTRCGLKRKHTLYKSNNEILSMPS